MKDDRTRRSTGSPISPAPGDLFVRAMNMQDINLNSWEEFEEHLQNLKDESIHGRYSSEFLYRGQRDHTRKLLTTLERDGQEKLSLKEYHHLIFVVKPQIESFTGVNWNMLSYPDGFEKWLKKNDTLIPNAFGTSIEFQDTYSYMVYLRHYGFPSPLLDWTSSPYVAAYFAFRGKLQADEKVSIYVFLESVGRYKMGSYAEPYIYKFGPYVRTDRRHFLQQSQYTICIVRDEEWRYVPHESAFARDDPSQDVLWKFNIPSSEKLKVLKLLDGYNLNALSLFGSEESLMETMALREIHFRDKKL
jgi:hypothetical protein